MLHIHTLSMTFHNMHTIKHVQTADAVVENAQVSEIKTDVDKNQLKSFCRIMNSHSFLCIPLALLK